MLEAFENIDFQQTDSVLEALILEANLIKKYQPPYNTALKDNKSFNYVVITKEAWPRVLLARGRDIEMQDAGDLDSLIDYKIAYSFGPFPQGSSIKDGLVLIRKIFPYRDNKCVPCEEQLKKSSVIPGLTRNPGKKMDSGSEAGMTKQCKPCFNRQIGLCPGVCTGEISKEEYKERIKNIVEFFRGNKKTVIKNLEKQMRAFADSREFEKAGEIKRQIFALNHIHDISLIKKENIEEKAGLIYRIEAYDVAHFAGKDVVGVMTVIENGTAQKAEYRKFKIKEDPGVNDTKALREILRRRLNHDEWRLPNLIVVDGAVAQKNAAEAVLFEFGYEIPVMAVTKNEYHKPKNILGDRMHLAHEMEILLANNEAHRYGIAYHRSKREGKF
jgi:excinuclease ABC subunit C